MLVVSMKIRPATAADCDAIWNIFHEVVADGDTYGLDPKIAREDALAYWFAPGTHTYVAQELVALIFYGLTNREEDRMSPTQDSWFQRALGGRGSVVPWRSIV